MKKFSLVNLVNLLILISALPLHAQWTQQVSGTTRQLEGVHFVDGNTGWAIARAIDILHTGDAGNTWTPQTNPAGGLNFFEVFFIDSNTGWIAADDGKILKTNNGGAVWSVKQTPLVSRILDLYFVSADTGWAVTNLGEVLKSIDGGETWSQQISGTSNQLTDVHFTDSNNGWVTIFSTTGSGVLQTVNGGATWSNQTISGSRLLSAIDFVNSSLGWTVGENLSSNNVIWKTSNGVTWTPQALGSPNLRWTGVQFPGSQTGWVAGYNETIMHTADGGNTWVKQNSEIGGLRLLDLFFYADQGWAVGDAGLILHFPADSSGTIRGYKFHDVNRDSTFNPSEKGLEGWTIELRNQSTGVTTTTVTDSLGEYTFADISPGTYRIREQLQAGWIRTHPVSPNRYIVNLPIHGFIDSLNFGNTIPDSMGAIHGFKFHDVNRDSVFNPTEQGLPGWTIELRNQSTGVTTTTVTDSLGRYWFMDLSPGTYRVREQLQAGWIRTHPVSPNRYIVTLTENQVVDSLNFGNTIPDSMAAIHGFKFNDVNRDSVFNPTEQGLPGWTIELRNQSTGVTTTTVTDSLGRYWFMNLSPGTYRVREQLQAGWIRTHPVSPNRYIVTLTENQVVDSLNFGNTIPDSMAAIHGFKFHDVNRDSVFNPTEQGLPGWTIELRNQSTGVTTTTVTDSLGRYWFMDLSPGTYRVREQLQAGWIRTHPVSPNRYIVTLTENEVVDSLNFGNTIPDSMAAIHGFKFHDVNRDSVFNPTEQGLPGWTIELRNQSTGVTTTTVTDSLGRYWFMDLPPGTYRVREQLQAGWIRTHPVSPNRYIVTLTENEVVDSLNFGNTIPDSMAAIHGFKFHDVNRDSTFNPTEQGLPGWTIELRNQSTGVTTTTVTDSLGRYWFMGLSPGTYRVREQLQAGWIRTHPVSPNRYIVTLTENEVVDSLNFGNTIPDSMGAIHGFKFHDVNRDSVFNPTEQGLPGWTIELRNQSTGVTTTTVTDSLGRYWFMGLSPGTYRVREQLQAGWIRTHPVSPNRYVVNLPENGLIDSLNFGNVLEDTLGSIHGFKWYDVVSDSIFAANEPGIAGWEIIITDTVTGFTDTTVTDSLGRYWFMGLNPGTYKVEEVLPPFVWTQTFPSFPFYHLVNLPSGGMIDSVNFGNTDTLSFIRGTKFNDLDGDGVFDPAEPGLEGWGIGIIDTVTGIQYNGAVTDSTGDYVIAGVRPGTYRIFEVQQSGWQQTFPTAPDFHIVSVLPGGVTIDSINFGNIDTTLGSIHGFKWYDVFLDSIFAPGEPGIAGWEIVITDTVTGFTDTTFTDSLGRYWFMGLNPGTYKVEEVLPPHNWIQTFPPHPFYHLVNLTSGGMIDSVNFGNTDTLSVVRGTKFDDLDGDGERDPGEPGLAGWTIIAIDSATGITTGTVTDSSGNYLIIGLHPGPYKIIEIQQPGWQQTFPPSPGWHEVIFPAGGVTLDSLNFGNIDTTLGSIHGIKWYDIVSDSIFAANEPGIAGWEIIITDTLTGFTDTTFTDSLGRYWFMGLDPGTYRVEEVLPPFVWTQTFPSFPFYHLVNLPSGGMIDSVNFGNTDTLSFIRGTKFNDLDGDGVFDPGEPGLAGWGIGIIDTVTGIQYTGAITGSTGEYLISGVRPGTYRIFEVQQSGWQQTFPTSPPFHIVDIPPGGVTIDSLNFGNIDTTLGSIHGFKWHDVDKDSIFDFNEEGLPGWNITITDTLTGFTDSTITDSLGRYWFMGLNPGTYLVEETPQFGWEQIFPGFPHTHLVNLPSGGMIDSVNFGNADTLGSIHGFKYHDVDSNGVFDFGEQGLPNWNIIISDSLTGFTDTTVTDSLGQYWFMDLVPSTYKVEEVQQPGWLQTEPVSPNFYVVVVGRGSMIDSLNFGNVDTSASALSKNIRTEDASVPRSFELFDAYPNPFNPETTIRFNLPQTSNTVLQIFSQTGQLIRTLVNNNLQAGQHSIKWNGTNDRGNRVSTGIYIYRLRAGTFTMTKRMVLIK